MLSARRHARKVRALVTCALLGGLGLLAAILVWCSREPDEPDTPMVPPLLG